MLIKNRLVTRGDYKFRTITAYKVWFHCKGCVTSYETEARNATHSVFRPTMGVIRYSEYIGKYYLCPDCEHKK